MSTGADPKTMPVTREYEEGHERIFGEREKANGREVRVHMPGHPRANKWGSVDVREIGDWTPGNDRVPVVDTSLSRQIRDHEVATGTAHASNYGPDWSERATKARLDEQRVERRESIKRTISSLPTRVVEGAVREMHRHWKTKG